MTRFRPENPAEKHALYFWGSVAAFTLIITLDIMLDFGVTSAIFALMSGKKRLILTEPLIKEKIQIRRKEDVIIPTTMNDPFDDLRALIKGNVPDKFKHIVVDQNPLDEKENPTMGEILNITIDKYSTYLEEFQLSISQHEMYPEDDYIARKTLKKIATLPIKELYEKDGGTQFKMIIKYQDGYHAMFKPMRMTRTQQTHADHFYYNDYERHNSEIASFHLDRILGFRRAIPVVGRVLNLTSEMYRLSDDHLMDTFYISPAGKICFTGHCDYYCDSAHPMCGNPDTIEGSFAAYLPQYKKARRKVWRHPWRRSYGKRRTYLPIYTANFCDVVRNVPPYDTGRRMFDIMDMAIFDFLIGNQDRHHYETFKTFNEKNTFPIHLDQGRGFGLPFDDDLEILLPLSQCCLIRKSTLKTLLDFHTGPKKLSAALNEATTVDPLYPLLWQPHLDALDRRNAIILKTIRDCIKSSS